VTFTETTNMYLHIIVANEELNYKIQKDIRNNRNIFRIGLV
jgi:hypothetical protein